MIKIRIDNREENLEKISAQWINQQINRRRTDGLNPCVQIKIDEPGMKMSPSTPTCAKIPGGGRPPNDTERYVFDLWEKLGLNKDNFSSGNIIAFLQQLPK